MTRRCVSIGLTLLAVLATIACSRSESSSTSTVETRALRVFAAASLTDVVEVLAERYDRPVETSFGGSSALARQIRDGAPADVFLSASPEWIEFLRDAEALAGEPIVLARNRLVAVAPPGSELTTAGLSEPRSLLGHLAPEDRIAIADEGVPAGEYARAALTSLGLLDAFQQHLVGQHDVRAVSHAVEQGELLAGFVYATDAKVAKVEVLFAFDPSSHPPIEYQAAALRGASEPRAAQDFLGYLQGDSARIILTEAGFALP